LRGLKGSLYEGGIRVPFIVRWPGRIKAGGTSDLPAVFYDVMPTICELAGAPPPKETDGLSILPTLLGEGEQKTHELIYWEFPSYGGQQAVRMGAWKGVRQRLQKGPVTTELYNLADDTGEKKDVAAEHPDILARIEKIMKEQHVPSAIFQLKPLDPPGE
jgi:arylsulfatase